MRKLTLPLLLLAALALVAFAGAGAATAKGCPDPKPRDYPGDGYFQYLSVTGVSCSKGLAIARAHYRCRVNNGGKDGRCNKRVDGFRCRENRGDRISTEYNAAVRCRKGDKRVRFGYQQNL